MCGEAHDGWRQELDARLAESGAVLLRGMPLQVVPTADRTPTVHAPTHEHEPSRHLYSPLSVPSPVSVYVCCGCFRFAIVIFSATFSWCGRVMARCGGVGCGRLLGLHARDGLPHLPPRRLPQIHARKALFLCTLFVSTLLGRTTLSLTRLTEDQHPGLLTTMMPSGCWCRSMTSTQMNDVARTSSNEPPLYTIEPHNEYHTAGASLSPLTTSRARFHVCVELVE